MDENWAAGRLPCWVFEKNRGDAFFEKEDEQTRIQTQSQLLVEKNARPPVQPNPFVHGKPNGNPLEIRNPSLEAQPAERRFDMSEWINCKISLHTPADVQPGEWGVEKPAQNGQTYVGMVTRRDSTWEGIAQRLSKPLEAGASYDWGMQLCHSEKYASGDMSAPDFHLTGFTYPACLRIWAGSYACERAELLAESHPIENLEWQHSTFRLKPTKTHEFILLEAFYNWAESEQCYNGHLLIDNLSNIQPVKTDTTE